MDTKFIRIYYGSREKKTIILNSAYTKEQLREVLEGGPVKEDIEEVLALGTYITEGQILTINFSSKSWIHVHYGRGYDVAIFKKGDKITINPDCSVKISS